MEKNNWGLDDCKECGFLEGTHPIPSMCDTFVSSRKKEISGATFEQHHDHFRHVSKMVSPSLSRTIADSLQVFEDAWQKDIAPTPMEKWTEGNERAKNEVKSFLTTLIKTVARESCDAMVIKEEDGITSYDATKTSGTNFVRGERRGNNDARSTQLQLKARYLEGV